MAEPNPSNVAPWYLRNINQALELDNVSGNVFLRTNSQIIGNVTIGSTIEAHVTELGNIDISGNTMPISGEISVVQPVEVTQGTDPWIISGNVIADFGANANINIANQNPAYLSAFEEPLAVTITPVIQQNAVYGLDPANWDTTQLNGGNVDVNSNSVWEVSSGTSPGGYSRLATSKYMTYHAGQGSMYRWTAAFTTTGGTDKNAYGIDNIVQNTGPIDREDGYSVGYSGSTVDNTSRKIGFLHRRNGSAQIQQLTVTVAPTGSQTATITLNNTPFTVALTTSTSTAFTAKQIANALIADPVAGQLWDIEACSNVITFIYYSPGPRTNTYSFSSTGAGTIAVAAFSQYVLGVNPTDVWTYVDDWDNQSIQFDPTKLNVFGLDMRWLGAGIVRLFMEDPATGNMVLMHTQTWASTSTTPHLNKPSLRLVYRSGTTNNAITPSQNVIVRGSSVFSGIQGVINQTTSSQSYYALDGTTRAKDLVWHMLSIQNPLTRGTDINKSTLVLQDMSVSAQANDPSVVYVIKNCVGTTSPILFQPIPNSTPFVFAQYSSMTLNENLSLDTIAIIQSIGVNGSSQFALGDYNLSLSPGETVSIFISSTNAINKTSVGLAWKVD